MTEPAMFQADKFCRMPRACVSCTRYQHVGYDHDKHCPFGKDSALSEPKTRTPYGRCSAHDQEVFATEICGSYVPEPHVIPTAVANRPEHRNPIQEKIHLVDAGGA